MDNVKYDFIYFGEGIRTLWVDLDCKQKLQPESFGLDKMKSLSLSILTYLIKSLIGYPKALSIIYMLSLP
jgi:hypothetical protein